MVIPRLELYRVFYSKINRKMPGESLHQRVWMKAQILRLSWERHKNDEKIPKVTWQQTQKNMYTHSAKKSFLTVK